MWLFYGQKVERYRLSCSESLEKEQDMQAYIKLNKWTKLTQMIAMVSKQEGRGGGERS